ncbi:MAG: DUF2442 domain-containing protein [Candidatus Electrothrix sp. ATG2]|nr:DUF2442 domain-containing protein [Candidatus Electrothrix sp. ATG2]
MLEVKQATYTGEYTLRLVFNNGMEGTANLKETIFDDKRAVFSVLKEETNFKNFKVEHSTVIWSDQLDLASEYLFFLAFRDRPELQEQFKTWGYTS